ncbi:MAG: glycerate kinase [Candidatus Sericytochromatia bacterium]|nr:glycerate kinase [Candidatus Sericytochromatia bacterium]
MKILLALDKFKGTLSSLEVAEALVEGLVQGMGQAKGQSDPGLMTEIWPVSDGGQGFLEALQLPLQLSLQQSAIHAPHGELALAQFGWQAQTQRVVIETCQATGLHLIPRSQRHPLHVNSLGLGELFWSAQALQPKEWLLGLGSSGTVDGGIGLAQALGYLLLDAHGKQIPACPEQIHRLAQIVPPSTPFIAPQTPVMAFCDVSNPLLGPNGGVAIYSPQKGAQPEDLPRLEAGLEHWVNRLCEDLQLTESASELIQTPGAGAAGGLGLGLKALLGAQLLRGTDQMLQLTGLESALPEADLLITGEGQFDVQSGFGKWPARLIQLAKERHIPVVLVTGQKLAIPQPAGVIESYALVDWACETENSSTASTSALVQIGAYLGKKWAQA